MNEKERAELEARWAEEDRLIANRQRLHNVLLVVAYVVIVGSFLALVVTGVIR